MPKRSGGRIARIGEDLAARPHLPLVQRNEIGLGHIDFAAHLAHVRPAGTVKPCGHIAQGADIGGDILRLEERRVGKRWVSTGWTWWGAAHYKKQKNKQKK